MKVLMRITVITLALMAALIAWGYWHVSTHAALYIQINDYGLRTKNRLYDSPQDATIVLFDELRSPLATARTVEPTGITSVLHPKLGDCSSVQASGGKAYSACYSEYSRWISGWVDHAKFATLKVGDCTIRDIPVSLARSKDGWALWWVPLPHIGGTPFEYVGLEIKVDTQSCTGTDLP